MILLGHAKKIIEKDNKNIIINNNIQTNIQNNNIQANIQNNIKLVTFGQDLRNALAFSESYLVKNAKHLPTKQEDFRTLTLEEKDDILNSAVNSICKYIKYIHFNEEKPENMNILSTNLRSSFIDVFESGKWKKYDTDKITDTLLTRSQRNIEEIIKENLDTSNYIISQTKNLIEDNDVKKVIKDQKKRIKVTLYNEKEKVIKNKIVKK